VLREPPPPPPPHEHEGVSCSLQFPLCAAAYQIKRRESLTDARLLLSVVDLGREGPGKGSRFHRGTDSARDEEGEPQGGGKKEPIGGCEQAPSEPVVHKEPDPRQRPNTKVASCWAADQEPSRGAASRQKESIGPR
jgi:hypothetical protein